MLLHKGAPAILLLLFHLLPLLSSKYKKLLCKIFLELYTYFEQKNIRKLSSFLVVVVLAGATGAVASTQQPATNSNTAFAKREIAAAGR